MMRVRREQEKREEAEREKIRQVRSIAIIRVLISAVNPHSIFADPDPAVFLNADPDPAAHLIWIWIQIFLYLPVVE